MRALVEYLTHAPLRAAIRLDGESEHALNTVLLADLAQCILLIVNRFYGQALCSPSCRRNAAGTIAAKGMPTTAQEGIDFRALFLGRTDHVVAGLIYTPKFSLDLVFWQKSTETPTVLRDNGTYQVVAVPYPAFVNGMKAKLFSVQVSTAP
jgi:hypothetical protein